MMRDPVLTRCLRGLVVIVSLLAPMSQTEGATPLTLADLSPDMTIACLGETLDDEEVLRDVMDGTPLLVDLGSIPVPADLTAFARLEDGSELFSLDVTVELPGGLIVGPRDVVRHDDGAYAIRFAGAGNGVPAGARIDAVTITADGHLLLSFDTHLESGKLSAKPGDLARFDGDAFTEYFSGEENGLPSGSNIDASHLLSNGRLLISLAQSGSVGGVYYDDEDVLEWEPNNGSWSLSLDLSTRCDAWLAADLDALSAKVGPERLCGDNVDNDGDGLTDCDDGDCVGPNAPDDDGDGLSVCAGDCDDGNGSVWSIPGETNGLTLATDKITLSWAEANPPGCLSPLYDTIRSLEAGNFQGPATCVEADDGSDLVSFDQEKPKAGAAFYYLVRAGNACGEGSAGKTSEQNVRAVRPCP